MSSNACLFSTSLELLIGIKKTGFCCALFGLVVYDMFVFMEELADATLLLFFFVMMTG